MQSSSARIRRTRRQAARCQPLYDRAASGVRTVQLCRGARGFGFTISGQAPCVLSCVAPDSAADAAGLRPGDCLLTVNGRSVADSRHDRVVQLVGACVGQLQLQVADGRPLTDSSDEEACGGGDFVVDQRELRTPPRVASATGRTSAVLRSAERTAARGGDGAEQCASLPRAARKCHRCAAAAASSSGDCRHCQPATRLRVVVGYLGSIEMPKLTGGGSGSDAHLTALGSCVRRLRVEKKVHTLVLMSVRLDGVVLSSIDGGVLARYAAACITFCGVCGDDRRFFGLVTASAAAAAGAASGDKPTGASHASSSCHVFMVDARLVAHVHHVRTARAFGVRCTGETTPDDSVCEQEATCREFPASSRPILRALVSLYRNRHVPGDTGAVVVAASSAPASWCGSVDDGGRDSPALSAGAAEAAAAAVVTPSSNSDSGVGFRDDMRLMNGRAVVAGRMRRGIPGDMAPPPAPPPVHCQSHYRRTVSGRLDGAAAAAAGRRRADLTVSAGGRYHTAGRVAGGMLGAHSAVVRSLDDVRLSAARHRRCGLHSRPHSSAGLPPPLPPPPPPTTTTTSRHMQRLCEESTWQTAGVVVGLDDVGSSNNNDVDDVRVGNAGDSLPENGVVPTSRCSSLSMAVQASHGRVSPLRCPATMPPHVDTDAARAPKTTSTTTTVKKAALLRPQHYETLDGGCDTADGAVLSSSAAGSSAAANAAVGSRVAGWSQSFDQLLHDPAGLHTFSEFLKSQFSHENIYFWAGCERYKRLATRGQRAAAARRLYDRHLCPGAPEPVNIDCHAHQYTLDQLTAVETMAASAAGDQHLDATLFDKAQQQIYKLMLYDCYPRFLKSSLLQDCEFLEQSGEPLPYLGGHLMDDDLRVQPARALQPPSVSSSGIKKFGRFVTGGARHNEQQQQQRRKSLLPWSRHKERAKSKDRGETEYNRLLTMKKRHKKPATSVPVALSDREDGGGGGSVRSSLSGSRTSLASAGNNVAVTSAFSDLSAASLATRWPSRELLSPEAGDSCDDDGGGGGGGAASSRTLPECGDCGLCRVLLPDRSWAVVQTVAGVSVRALLRRVLERRGLLAPPSGGGGGSSEQRSWDVYICGVQRPLNQSLDSTLALAGRQVRMEQRVLFRLQLPPAVVEHVNNGCGDGQAASVGKAVGVKARPNRRVREVLQPILAKYAVNLEQCVVSKCGGGVVDLNVSVTCIDNMSLRVSRAASSCGNGGGGGGGDVSLDVITSRVFDELLRARADELILDDIDAEESTDAKQYTGDAVFVSSSTSQVLGSRNDSRAFMNGGGECWLSGEPDTASDKSGRLASQTVSRHSHHHHHHHHHQNHRRRSATDTHINFDPPDFLDGGQVPAGGPPRARLDVTLSPPPSNEFHRRSVSLVCSPPPPPLPPKPRASVALDASVPRRQDRDPPAPPPTSSSLHQQRLVSERSRRAVYIDKTDALSISFV